MGSWYEDENHNQNYFWVHGPIIIGAGPSGLAVAACLKENGVPSLILERNDCLASLWQQKTYDRVQLHLPKKLCELPSFKFPENYPKYPTKHQFISYLETYAKNFSIEPRFNQVVENAEFDHVESVWKVQSQDSLYVSRWIIVATGENAEPVIPEIQGFEIFNGVVMHSSEYKSGIEFQNQSVLVVGCGNSGMEVCLDLCRYNALPHMVVRSTVHVLPREIYGISTFTIAMELQKWLPLKIVDKFLLLVANFTFGNTDKLGLKRPKTGPIELKNTTGKTPVLDVATLSKIKAGKIKVTGGLREITRNGVKFIDGQVKEFDTIILATGYKSNVPSWLKESDFFTKEEGMPKEPFPNGWKGVNGLYAVGFTRRGLLGTASNAINIAKDIAHQWKLMQLEVAIKSTSLDEFRF